MKCILSIVSFYLIVGIHISFAQMASNSAEMHPARPGASPLGLFTFRSHDFPSTSHNQTVTTSPITHVETHEPETASPHIPAESEPVILLQFPNWVDHEAWFEEIPELNGYYQLTERGYSDLIRLGLFHCQELLAFLETHYVQLKNYQNIKNSLKIIQQLLCNWDFFEIDIFKIQEPLNFEERRIYLDIIKIKIRQYFAKFNQNLLMIFLNTFMHENYKNNNYSLKYPIFNALIQYISNQYQNESQIYDIILINEFYYFINSIFNGETNTFNIDPFLIVNENGDFILTDFARHWLRTLGIGHLQYIRQEFIDFKEDLLKHIINNPFASYSIEEKVKLITFSQYWEETLDTIIRNYTKPIHFYGPTDLLKRAFTTHKKEIEQEQKNLKPATIDIQFFNQKPFQFYCDLEPGGFNENGQKRLKTLSDSLKYEEFLDLLNILLQKQKYAFCFIPISEDLKTNQINFLAALLYQKALAEQLTQITIESLITKLTLLHMEEEDDSDFPFDG